MAASDGSDTHPQAHYIYTDHRHRLHQAHNLHVSPFVCCRGDGRLAIKLALPHFCCPLITAESYVVVARGPGVHARHDAMSDYLPIDVWSHIILRFPVKSILRCGSISKSWYSLIHSPAFTASHLSYQRSANKTQYVLLTYKSLRFYNSTFSRYIKHEFPVPLPPLPLSDEPDVNSPLRPHGSSNGLICCSLYVDTSETDYTLFIWNSATRNVKMLPTSLIYPPENDGYKEMYVAFGFHPRVCDYKVVQMLFSGFQGSYATLAEVYSVKTDSWKMISISRGNQPYFMNSIFHLTFVNGVTYWVAEHWVTTTSASGDVHATKQKQFVVSVDLGNVVLEELDLPGCVANLPDYVSLDKLGEKLCMMHWFWHQTAINDYHIWVLHDGGTKECWAKMFTISITEHISRITFTRNGGVLLVDMSQVLMSYDIETKEIKDLDCCGDPVMTFLSPSRRV